MYVPTNIAAPTATYAPVTATTSPAAITQTQALSAARQTEVAVTGLGPSLLSNTISNRTAANTTRSTSVASSVATPSVLEGVGDSTFTTPTAPLARPLAQVSLPQPRPAYIAAQFLAQDLSPQEVAQFFAADIQPAALRQPNPAREVRVATLANNTQSTPITINQSALASAPPPVQVRTQQPAQQAEPVQRQDRRSPAVAQVQGQSAYRAANIRNALLASTPEVDTRF